MNPLLITLILGGAFLALFAIAELLYHWGRVQAEYTRKLVHFGTGILTLLFPLYLQNHWYVLLLCASFALILILSLRFNQLQSINAIQRKSHGSISYPVSVYACFLFYTYAHQPPQLAFYYIPILTLAICDPLAALLGKRFPWKPFKVGEGKKTITGTLCFFIAAFALSFCILHFSKTEIDGMHQLAMAVSIAAATSAAEAFSPKGLDNLTIPAAAMLTIYLMEQL